MEARAAAQTLAREAQARAARRGAIAAERASWDERRDRALARIAEFAERRAEAERERGDARRRAGRIRPPPPCARRRIRQGGSRAQGGRRRARAAGETALADADRAARQALEAMAEAREQRAASEERVEGARSAAEQLLHAIRPISTASLPASPRSPVIRATRRCRSAVEIERKLDNLAPGARAARRRQPARRRRARRGRGEPRPADRRARRSDRGDQAAAHRHPAASTRRAASGSSPPSKSSTGTFEDLFQTLFEGGKAELQLIESDDPLEAGLELVAQPPGKKPQTLTLLSGGEQALTALALIFAVFLTNPSPICVLDEVDAPLDDYNVERFCDLLDEMRKRSDTRFVTITHNPITMARMDRLFGVTMAERGVSQIVSVELAEAERFAEAG